MNREIHGWHSPALNKFMEIAVYGHFGFPLLLLPTAAADYLEYERFQMIDVLKPYIEAGKVKVFSINSINSESWLNNKMEPRHKAIRHVQFNNYVYNEVVPFIHEKTSPESQIIVSGASLGALLSANFYFKRPDLIGGIISMSGDYDLTHYTKGYFDEDVYFNSPLNYLPGLNDEAQLSLMRANKHIHILTGSGDYENPESTKIMEALLNSKGISAHVEIWGSDMSHDWPTWRRMLPYVIETRF
jgi:esterase/lipase superfamily enzyme